MESWEITAEELRRLLERGAEIALLDVRAAEDRKEWFIPGSVHRDIYGLLQGADGRAMDGVSVPPGSPVVVVCNRGRTSMLVVELLRRHGIPAVSLRGGMQAWSLAWNLAEVSLEGTSILQVRRTGKGCLSYLVASAEEAAVIDPSVEADVYLELAASRGWRITRVLDTHVHADHLSRARALAELTGAAVHLPEQKRVRFPFVPVRDGDNLAVGKAKLEVLSVPGHTFESACYLLDGRALFTGDTLFFDSVGRPDLAAGDQGEARERASSLYRSLGRIAALPGETVVLPGHTAQPVPFDRRPLMDRLAVVLERVELLRLSEGEFVEAILSRLPPPPANHLEIVRLNEEGRSVDDPTLLEAGANRCAVA